jgi:hypothetical protein
LLDRLQNGTHRGKGGAADQSIHGRMGLGTAYKEETLKNDSMVSSGGRKSYLRVEENCVFTEKFIYFLAAPAVFDLFKEKLNFSNNFQ